MQSTTRLPGAHLQVIAAAEAFRVKYLQARRGTTDEHLLWISGSRSQPASEVLAIMTGLNSLHVAHLDCCERESC